MVKLENVVYKHLPRAVKETVIMKKVNSDCRIYKGEFDVKIEDKNIEANGIIYFGWLGNNFGVNIEGYVLTSETELFTAYLVSSKVSIYIKGEYFGNGFLTKIEGIGFKVKLSNSVVKGDINKAVERVNFLVPNLLPLQGLQHVVKETAKRLKSGLNRVVLESRGYKIILDLKFDSSDIYKSLKENGGYGLTYTGEIIKNDGELKYEECGEILDCLSRFLSFINGRKVSPLFREGYVGQKKIWKDYTGYKNEPFKDVVSWTPSLLWTNEHLTMWTNFSNYFFDDKYRMSLSSVIYWYLEANGNSGIEVRSVLAQSALELIFNWFYEKGMIDSSNGDANSNGAAKLRSILRVINYTNEVPNSLVELSKFLNSYKVEKEMNKKTKEYYYPEKDACFIITKIRNALVHADHNNRKRLAKIPTKVMAQSVNLSLVYIEMALLYILEYNGKFKNRCSPLIWGGQEDFMPWVKNTP